jgi:hypothetical protein
MARSEGSSNKLAENAAWQHRTHLEEMHGSFEKLAEKQDCA